MNSEFPSNSHRKRDPDFKIESVVVNKVVAGKKPLGRRLRDMVFAGDGRSAAQSVIADVVIPQIKDMAAEAVREAIERLIFGDRGGSSSRRSSPYRPGNRPGYTNYGASYSGRSHSSRVPREERGPNASLRTDAIEYIVLSSRSEAEEVLDRMLDVIEKYEFVSVADLKSMIEWSADLTDQDWGWDNLESARVSRDRNGYVLNLPKPQPLK